MQNHAFTGEDLKRLSAFHLIPWAKQIVTMSSPIYAPQYTNFTARDMTIRQLVFNSKLKLRENEGPEY